MKILANLRHLASTIPGVMVGLATSVLAFTNLPGIQQLAGSNAQAAKYVTAIVGLATSITLIFGVGPKQK